MGSRIPANFWAWGATYPTEGTPPLLLSPLVHQARSVRSASSPAYGGDPFGARCRVVLVPEMDSSDQHVDVFFPAANTTQPGDKFPLVVFMHGFWGGGGFTNIYYPIVSTIASYGYVVVLPRACNLACFDDKATLPGDPLGFAHYYQQQLRAIVWASEQAESATDGPFALVNSTVGVGIAGHSMGGQATLFSSAKTNTTAYNIRAAVPMPASPPRARPRNGR